LLASAATVDCTTEERMPEALAANM
jgi:hypothetical protein